MKKLLIICALISSANAYNIGGAYATLVSCDYGQYGYQYGYIGTYNVNGMFYKEFFGNRFCQY